MNNLRELFLSHCTDNEIPITVYMNCELNIGINGIVEKFDDDYLWLVNQTKETTNLIDPLGKTSF